MKRLLIIGAGGFGRELLSWANHVPPTQRDWQVGGFLDSNPTALQGFHIALPILDDPETYAPAPNDVFVCAIGEPKTRLRVCRGLEERGADFVTLIHPTAVIGNECHFGKGCIFCPGAVVTVNVSLGDFVILNVHATVGHDVAIGAGCTLSAHADVTGAARLEDGVFLGSHAVILPNAVVGAYAVVGAGSVVMRRVMPGSTVIGVPARQIVGFSVQE